MSTQSITCVVAVNAIVVHKNQILLLKHNRPEKARGKYGLPGGKVEQGETFIQGLVREVYEEVGIGVREESIKKLCILHDFPETTCKHLYLIHIDTKTNDFIFDHDAIQSVDWVDEELIKDIDVEDFRNDRVYKVLLDYVNGRFENADFVYTLN